ncbi:MAG TPA: DNA repair protein RecN [Alphaproteobacteria bacterium]|nr:DNA repair protein RecN [Alphaproteobacteria bacterium]
MLAGLSIRDVVTIDRLDLSFRPGLNVLTGETGAGKSILLDALGLALGARSESTLLRPGATQATVSAAFELTPDHPARALLRDHGLDAEGDLVLRRVLSADGRTRAFINDQPTSIGLLRQTGETLIEIQGQFEQHGLLDPATHRGVLDAYGGLADAAAATRAAHAAWRTAERALAEAEGAARTARADEDFLRHALAELDALKPRPGEEKELADLRAALLNKEKIVEALAAADAELTRGRPVEDALRAAEARLERVAAQSADLLDPVIAALDRAAVETAEAVRALRSVEAAFDSDSGRLEDLEERLFALRDLARKHRVAVDALPALRDDIAGQLGAIDDQGGTLQRLGRAAAEAKAAYRTAATDLSKRRRAAAKKLDAAVARELPPLKLDKARFVTHIDALDEADWSADGMDRIAFEIATVPGAAPGPLRKVASGGELSRLMLALKVILSRAEPIPTLIFDEVDSGVGGATAAAVGERLASLAAQVLVVTHSPQVAARGVHHWRVQKSEARGKLSTRVDLLEPAARREEIARMLSGREITDEARAAADRLIAAGGAA